MTIFWVVWLIICSVCILSIIRDVWIIKNRNVPQLRNSIYSIVKNAKEIKNNAKEIKSSLMQFNKKNP